MVRKFSYLMQARQYAIGIATEVLYAILLAIVALVISALALRWF